MNGEHVPGTTTPEELVDLKARLVGLAHNTRYENAGSLKRAMKTTGKRFIEELDEADARLIRDDMLDRGRSGAYIKQQFRNLRSLLDIAVEEGLVETNPFHAVKLERIRTTRKPKQVQYLHAVDAAV